MPSKNTALGASDSLAGLLVWILLGSALATGLTIRCVAKGLTLENDASAYVSGAIAVREGLDLYTENHVSAGEQLYAYPPVLAILLAPLLVFGVEATVVIWSIVSIAALVFSCVLLAKSIPGLSKAQRVIIAVLPAAASLRALDSNFGNGQANSLVLLSFCAALYYLVRGRSGAAGIAVGCGAVLKVLPIGLLAYFLFTRRWRACGGLLASLLVFGGLLPLLVLGPERTRDSYASFARVAAQYSQSGREESYKPDAVTGQSLRALVFRSTRPIDATRHDRDEIRANVVSLGGATAEWISRLLAAAIAVLGVVLWGWRGGARGGREVLFDLSVAAVVALLAAPYVRKAYHVLLILPYAYLVLITLDIPWRRLWPPVAWGCASVVGFVAVVGWSGIEPPWLAMTAFALALTSVFRIDRERRHVWALAMSVSLSLFTAPGLVGRALASELLGLTSLGLSVLIVLMALIDRAWQERSAPTLPASFAAPAASRGTAK